MGLVVILNWVVAFLDLQDKVLKSLGVDPEVGEEVLLLHQVRYGGNQLVLVAESPDLEDVEFY
jgi:hypothetical protein